MSIRSYAGLVPVLVALGIGACGGDEQDRSELRPVVADPGPVHVHGLGVNPADGALFLATHTGLFRVAPGVQQARRVADRYQDTMGFTVTGPDRFLGSGHPDGRDRLPPFLGLIRSSDAGRRWQPVSLLGERDFHVLEASGQRIYGFGSDFDSRQEGMVVSRDAGGSWEERNPPEPLVALAIDPSDDDRVVAAGERGLYSSDDGGRRWRTLSQDAGLLAWTESRGLFVAGADGSVARSGDGGRTWEPSGRTGGQPAAFDNAGDELYVARHDGTIMRSEDGGRSWRVRFRP